MLAEHFPDSMFTFPNQQELQNNYQDSTPYFKILFQNKLYLMSKKGIQLSTGFDNISSTNASGFFETENNSEFEKIIVRQKGLIDSTGFTVVKCKYNQVDINQEDSSIYCCSAIFNSNLNDDVFNYKGKLIYSNRNHIVFSSKIVHVLKLYDPNEHFIIENTSINDRYVIEGVSFYYIKNSKALVINKENWWLLDIETKSKQKIDKEIFYRNLYNIFDY